MSVIIVYWMSSNRVLNLTSVCWQIFSLSMDELLYELHMTTKDHSKFFPPDSQTVRKPMLLIQATCWLSKHFD